MWLTCCNALPRTRTDDFDAPGRVSSGVSGIRIHAGRLPAEVNKRQNSGVDHNEVVRALHDHKLGVIASCILGMDSHDKDYHQALIRSLKESKADLTKVFLMTASMLSLYSLVYPRVSIECAMSICGRISNP